MQAELEKCVLLLLRDFTQVESEAEDRIVVINPTIVGAFRVRQEAVVDEIGSHFNVLCRLVSQLLYVICGIIPARVSATVSPIRIYGSSSF